MPKEIGSARSPLSCAGGAGSSVFAGLNATVPARAIYDDPDGVAEPITELGKLHHAWLRERGLPSPLDHHDHP